MKETILAAAAGFYCYHVMDDRTGPSQFFTVERFPVVGWRYKFGADDDEPNLLATPIIYGYDYADIAYAVAVEAPDGSIHQHQHIGGPYKSFAQWEEEFLKSLDGGWKWRQD